MNSQPQAVWINPLNTFIQFGLKYSYNDVELYWQDETRQNSVFWDDHSAI